jgi:hypothetical protein
MAKKQNDSAEHRAELAEHIAAIVADPLTPAYLYEATMNFLTSESSELWAEMLVTAPIIERVLERGGCGYILCPGSKDGTCPGPQAHKKGGAR